MLKTPNANMDSCLPCSITEVAKITVITYLYVGKLSKHNLKLLKLHVEWRSTTFVFYFSITLTVNRTHNAVAT